MWRVLFAWAFNFWLTFLEILLIWFSKVGLIGIRKNTCSSSDSIKLLSIVTVALELPEIYRWLLLAVTFM